VLCKPEIFVTYTELFRRLRRIRVNDIIFQTCESHLWSVLVAVERVVIAIEPMKPNLKVNIICVSGIV
jgi:hypothetical protein